MKVRIGTKWKGLLALSAALFFLFGGVVAWRYRVQWVRFANVRVAMTRNDLATAEQLLLELREQSVALDEVNFLLAVVSRRAGRLNEVDPYLRAATNHGWSASRVELERCLMYAQSGRVEDVENRLREIVQLGVPDRDAEEIYSALAMGFMAEFRMREAWDCLEFWLEWQPGNVNARMMRADICERIGQRNLVIEEYRTILNHAPEHRTARVELSKALAESGEVTAANEQWLECAKRFPGDVEVLAGLSQTSRRLGKIAESVAYAERALPNATTDQQRSVILLELGQSLMADREFQKAIKILKTALDAAPSSMKIHHALAQASIRIGDSDLAATHRSTAQALSSQNLRITELTQQLLHAPRDANIRCELGEILLSRGRTAEARKWAETALKFQPDHADSKTLMAKLIEQVPTNAPLGDESVVERSLNASERGPVD